MKPLFSSCKRFVACALIVALSASAAVAQEPPIRILVGFAPGGVTDVVARVLAQGMQGELGRAVIVENRAGAGGQIAAQVLKASRPDGATLYLTNSHTTAMIPLTTINPGYDPVKDFVNVGLVAINPNFFMVSNAAVDTSVNSIKDFAQWAKAHPSSGNIGVPAPGSTPEFSVTTMGQTYGADLKAVPYRGDAPLVQDLISGQIPAGIAGVATALPHVRSGKLKLLAVDGPQRLPGFPDIPTYGELGLKGLDDVIFIGVIAPAGVPADLVTKYGAAINKVVQSKAFQERLSETGIVPKAGSAEDMMRMTEASRQSNGALLKAAGFKPQ